MYFRSITWYANSEITFPDFRLLLWELPLRKCGSQRLCTGNFFKQSTVVWETKAVFWLSVIYSALKSSPAEGGHSVLEPSTCYVHAHGSQRRYRFTAVVMSLLFTAVMSKLYHDAVAETTTHWSKSSWNVIPHHSPVVRCRKTNIVPINLYYVGNCKFCFKYVCNWLNYKIKRLNKHIEHNKKNNVFFVENKQR